MENLKEPGIILHQVRLLKAHIEMINPDAKPEYNLGLAGLARVESEDGKFLDLFASFDVMRGVKKPLFKFTCDFVARYERQGDESMTWREFATAMALAHIIPYLREFLSNMTNRLPVPVLMLRPINVHAMIAAYEELRRQSSRKAPKKPRSD